MARRAVKTGATPAYGGNRAVTADTDLRLCRFFGLSSGYWLRAQAAHDTEVAERKLSSTLARIRPWAKTREKAAS